MTVPLPDLFKRVTLAPGGVRINTLVGGTVASLGPTFWMACRSATIPGSRPTIRVPLALTSPARSPATPALVLRVRRRM